MQRSYTKLVRTKTNQLFLFYVEDSCLYFKAYTNEGISAPQLVMDHVLPYFSLSVTPDEIPYILIQDQNQKLWLLRHNATVWDKKILLEQVPKIRPYTSFYLSLDGEKATLLYNAVAEEDGCHNLVYTTNIFGKWETPKKIDMIVPMDEVPYQVYDVAEGHILLCYLTPEGTIVCREVLLSPFTLGHPAPIIQAGRQCLDLCLLPAKDRIHILYIVKKGTFRQLVYKNKYRTKISAALLLCEGIKLDNCCLFYGKNLLWVMWTMNGQLYYVTSEDNGASFCAPKKYRTPPFSMLCKCDYINYKKMRHNAAAIYVTQPDTPVLVSDIADDFYPPVVGTLRIQSEDFDNKLAGLQKENQQLYAKIADLEKKIEALTSMQKHTPQAPTEKPADPPAAAPNKVWRFKNESHT